MHGIALDSQGNIFIADVLANRIRKVGTDGIIKTVAGNGDFGYSGDGDPAIEANLSLPEGIAVDSQRNLFIADTGNDSIRKVDPNGTLTTVAGNGLKGFSGDGGPATIAQLHAPYGVAVDPLGNLFIADTLNNRIRKVGANGIITTVAGNGSAGFSGDGGRATEAQLWYPRGIAVDYQGNPYIADTDNNRIRKVDMVTRTISTVAGNGLKDFSRDGDLATEAKLGAPEGIAIDPQGNLFIADTRNHRIRKVDKSGRITTVAGGAEKAYYLTDTAATDVSLYVPNGVALDSQGNLFIAEMLRIRKVTCAQPGSIVIPIEQQRLQQQ